MTYWTKVIYLRRAILAGFDYTRGKPVQENLQGESLRLHADTDVQGTY